MPLTATHQLIHRFIAGDPAAAASILESVRSSHDPLLLVAAALADPSSSSDLLARARECATHVRDRQLVAIATAHLADDGGRVDALARDHLADYPDSILVAWIAAAASDSPRHRQQSEQPVHRWENS